MANAIPVFEAVGFVLEIASFFVHKEDPTEKLREEMNNGFLKIESNILKLGMSIENSVWKQRIDGYLISLNGLADMITSYTLNPTPDNRILLMPYCRGEQNAAVKLIEIYYLYLSDTGDHDYDFWTKYLEEIKYSPIEMISYFNKLVYRLTRALQGVSICYSVLYENVDDEQLQKYTDQYGQKVKISLERWAAKIDEIQHVSRNKSIFLYVEFC